jgi:hypothetical protein
MVGGTKTRFVGWSDDVAIVTCFVCATASSNDDGQTSA